MTDDARTPHAAPGPDWDRLAHDIAEEGEGFAPAIAAADPRGAEHAALLMALAGALRAPQPAPPTSAEVERALAAVLARRDHPVALPAARPAHRPLRWAAAAAAVLVVAGLAWQQSRDGRPSGSREGVATTFALARATTAGQVDSLRLPDGSRIVLGPSTTLDTSAAFGAGAREVRVRGSAYFDVTHDATHPFVVRAAQGILRDIGTSFVVRTEAPGGLVVAVASGEVALRASGAAPADERHLVAGDRAVLASGGALHVDHAAGAELDLAATRARLVLDDAPLSRVAEAMRRWYGIELRVDDPALAARRVTASFTTEPGIDAARVIAAAMGASIRVAGDTVHLRLAPVQAR